MYHYCNCRPLQRGDFSRACKLVSTPRQSSSLPAASLSFSPPWWYSSLPPRLLSHPGFSQTRRMPTQQQLDENTSPPFYHDEHNMSGTTTTRANPYQTNITQGEGIPLLPLRFPHGHSVGWGGVGWEEAEERVEDSRKKKKTAHTKNREEYEN